MLLGLEVELQVGVPFGAPASSRALGTDVEGEPPLLA